MALFSSRAVKQPGDQGIRRGSCRAGKGGRMNTEGTSFIPVGTLVILRDKQRGYIEQVTLESGKPVYTVGMKDGSVRIVDSDGLMSARAYAELVAPGSDWDLLAWGAALQDELGTVSP
jgi:hypothetical protein